MPGKNPFKNKAKNIKDVSFWVEETIKESADTNTPVSAVIVIVLKKGKRFPGRNFPRHTKIFFDEAVPTSEFVFALQQELFILQMELFRKGKT